MTLIPELSETTQSKAAMILVGAAIDYPGNGMAEALAAACALLTSPIKAERERGKQMVRDWRQPLILSGLPAGKHG